MRYYFDGMGSLSERIRTVGGVGWGGGRGGHDSELAMEAKHLIFDSKGSSGIKAYSLIH